MRRQTAADKVLLALSGNAWTQLPDHHRRAVRAEAVAILTERHRAEFEALLHEKATRIINNRSRGLW